MVRVLPPKPNRVLENYLHSRKAAFLRQPAVATFGNYAADFNATFSKIRTGQNGLPIRCGNARGRPAFFSQ